MGKVFQIHFFCTVRGTEARKNPERERTVADFVLASSFAGSEQEKTWTIRKSKRGSKKSSWIHGRIIWTQRYLAQSEDKDLWLKAINESLKENETWVLGT